MHVAAAPPDLDAWLATIAGASGAILELAELPVLLGLDQADATEAVGLLAEGGWIEAWERPDATAVVLTALAAQRLGIELEAPADGATIRWVPAGTAKAEKALRYRAGRPRNETDVYKAADGSAWGLDALPDPKAVDPCEAFIRRYGEPWIIKGLRPAWPVKRVKGEPCPGCFGKVGPGEACVVCNRATWDKGEPLVSVQPAKAKPSTAVVVAVPVPSGLAGGKGPSKGGKVKGKHKAKRKTKAA